MGTYTASVTTAVVPGLPALGLVTVVTAIALRG
jgi:hypothetical protein